MINNVVLVGRLTRDPELRYTANGAAVATFSLAVNRNFTNQSGEREADFINCVIWRKPAETLANYARKGTLLGVTGRIQTRNYENQQGQKVYVTEVVAENFQLLESRNASERRGADTGFSGNQSTTFNNNQTQTSQPSNGMPNFDRDTSDPFGSSSIDISDDDLPF
ncbi:MAG: single-stranded DNA-binding protein [Enterococcus italicus]|uniref:single-stranded DNA-binding protein n=1 Tax=Enterococcus italicus TaxID=246144 RepID=UPI0025953658|nr:single-stranded DNA-binding protein [uncultured Enterococcus sp.]